MNTRFSFLSHRFPALVLAVAIFTSAGSGSAFAATTSHPFQDVATDAPYANGVQFVYDNNISCGTGEKTFSPERAITFGELSLMLCRMYWPDEEWDVDNATAKVGIDCMGRIVNPVISRDERVSNSTAYQALLSCSNAPIYSQKLCEAGIETQSDDAVYTASQIGLCEESVDSFALLTRGEAAQMIYEASQLDLEMAPPSIVVKLDVTVEDEYKSKCTPFLEEAAKIPAVILDRFEDENWSLTIGNDYILQWEDENDVGGSIVGLTVYATNAIYVCNVASVVHEFGHFLHSQLGYPQEIDDLYQKESESAKLVIGDYALTNEMEYFAEFFESWIRASNDRLQELKTAAPETFAYFETLEASGWLPE